MAVAVIVENDSDVRSMVGWGARLARCTDNPLLVIHPAVSDGQQQFDPVPFKDAESPPTGLAAAVLEAWRASVCVATCDDDVDNADGGDSPGAATQEERHDERGARPELTFFRLRDPRGATALLDRLSELGVDLLVLPADDAANGRPSSVLLDVAPCATLLLRANGAGAKDGPIVTPTVGRHHDHESLRLAAKLAACESRTIHRASQGSPAMEARDANRASQVSPAMEARTVHAVYVEEEIGDLAQVVGTRMAERQIAFAMADPDAHIVPKTVVTNKVERGIKEAAENAHLLLIGVRATRSGGKPLSTLAARLLKWEEGPPVAVLRPALPLHHRFVHSIERWVGDRLPQLTRDERVALVDRIQSGSQFNIDFVALICLSTLIAALGLARNQAAVIIGAMLVAPLMTPLMGFGLALMQGNLNLARQSTKSVCGGFTLALLIGVGVGLLIVNLESSDEMLGRGQPGVLDLLVAFVSGMAAAYAVGRPGLSSALPGVAIAAALVPPIATAGMALAIREWSLASGALLLFLTNIVAIALGAGVGLWAVGIRSRHQHGGYESWSGWVITLMVLATIGLAVYESQPAMSFASMPSSLEQDLQHVVDGHLTSAHLDLRRSTLRESNGAIRVELRLQSSSPATPELAAALQAELEQRLPHLNKNFHVELITELSVTAPEASNK
ncbi:MAG: TIGR00341 family protein [Planctomycetales bacterium]|nr:TIGR00341 family protein [Planctomycetales bacterium]